jgi:hypothetical protein
MPYIFLDPDGTQEFGLFVIVAANTGVIYAQQCGGTANEIREQEGFLIPVGGPKEAKKLYDWFWYSFYGQCYSFNPELHWFPGTIKALARLISEIPCWLTFPYEGEDNTQRLFLKLDEERMEECIEAWIPVITPYGKGILTLDNSD